MLPFYNAYFGVAYPLPKLDLVAIPGNYAAGAMENWGAITYIDDALLFDPATSVARTRETIALDVAHEMAHQWSGDLVTMAWWDNIWLNEGFATWMELQGGRPFQPDLGDLAAPARGARGGDGAGRAADDAPDPAGDPRRERGADSAFDRISYQKGEQVIRMIEDWIGPTFPRRHAPYMKAHAFSNATSADLWAAWAQASQRDVSQVAPASPNSPASRWSMSRERCRDGHGQLTPDARTGSPIHDPNPKALAWTHPGHAGWPGPAPHTCCCPPAGHRDCGRCDAR